MPTATKRPDQSREAREYRRSTGASFKRGKSNTEYATPDDFMNAVTARFGSVSFDLAATKENAKAADYYDLAHDSLAQDWHKLRGLLFLNPPFDKIAPWAISHHHCRSKLGSGYTMKAYTVTIEKNGKQKDIEVNAPSVQAVRELVKDLHPGWRFVRAVQHQ